MKKAILLILALLAMSVPGFCQSPPYALLPAPQSCFTNSNGAPLAGGFLYSYAAGSSTPQATYHIDTLGNITPNTNPIILPATGCAEVRLAAEVYKFVLQDSNHNMIWAVDQVQDIGQVFYGEAVLLNPFNGALQTIAGPLAVNSIAIAGQAALMTSAQSGTGSLCMTTNCGMTNPTLNGVYLNGQPGTYWGFLINAGSGTANNTLTKLITGGVAESATADVGGIIGICTSGCGTTGTAVVQQSGASLCVFDGSITSGDYVQNSPTVNGDCHDAGALYPSFGQVIGRVANTASGAGLYGIDLFSPEIQGKGTSVCANAAATSVSGNTTAQQIMDTCEFPAGSLNSVNKTFRLSNFFSANPSSSTSSFSWGFGTASSLGIYKVLGSQTSSSSLWNGSSQLICMVQTAGSGGTLNCTPQIEFTVPASATQTLSNFSVSVDFTQPLYIGTSCAFGTASTSNACETTTFLVEQLN